tara:strand:+ start:806 stop:1384 length:579 start_codon:yes stop_codon:yes gene_type:complete
MASTLTVDTIQGSTNADNVKLPKGCILQVEQTFYNTNTTTFVKTDGFVDIYSVNITPKFATSKVLVTIDVNVGHVDSYSALIRCRRNSTYIGGGVAIDSNEFDNIWFNVRGPGAGTLDESYAPVPCSQSFLDSPATTSQLTYTVVARQSDAAGGAGTTAGKAGRINLAPDSSANATYTSPTSSAITVMEIAQ